MADVVTTIEAEMAADISQAIAATSGRCVIGFSENEKHLTRPWAQLEIGEGDDTYTDSVRYMDVTKTAHVVFHADSRDAVRVCQSACRVLFEPLPTDWSGVTIIDIVPGAEDGPYGPVNASHEFVGTIDFIVRFRVNYA